MNESDVVRPRTGSAKGIFQLNRQIQDLLKKKSKLTADSQILAQLMKEFSKLVVDKVALENAGKRDGTNVDLDFQISRVILGRLRAAATFFEISDVPLSSQRRSKLWHCGLSTASWTELCISKRTAETRLHELAGEYLVLRARFSGIKETIKRFEEDNKALRQDVSMIQRSYETRREYQSTDNTWNRMANADLLKSHRYQLQDEMSRRRMSAISLRSVNSTTARPRSLVGRPSSAAESWMGGNNSTSSIDLTQRSRSSVRRRSGASYMNSWGSDSGDCSLDTTDTAMSDLSQTSVLRPKRYSAYDSWGKKIPSISV